MNHVLTEFGVRPNKKICVVQVTWLKKLGSVGRKIFFFIILFITINGCHSMINHGYMFNYVPNNVNFEKERVSYSFKFFSSYEHLFLFMNIENCGKNE